MTRAHAEAARSISNAAEENKRSAAWKYNLYFNEKKEVIKVVLLDELKATLLAYEEPLKDLRDSL